MTKTFKKSVAFLSAAVMVMAILLYFPGGFFSIDFGLKASAEGITLKEPSKDSNGVYQIGTAGELYWFAACVNSGTNYACAVLTTDITVNTGVLKSDGSLAGDTSGFTSWTPIGYDNGWNGRCKYTGTFDGQGHKISGLYFNDTSQETGRNVGLFGCVGNGCSVSNVGVVDSYFKGKEKVGGVCGCNDPSSNGTVTITNCYNTGAVSGIDDYVGGVCGYNDVYQGTATITNCYNTGAVSGNGIYIGGVCGRNEAYSSGTATATITNCYNTGAVTATSKHSPYVGGVCGYNYARKGTATITNCYNTGAVTATYKYYYPSVGGVCGINKAENGTATITNCYNTGAVNATSEDATVGGVCGEAINGTITNCYFDSTVYSGEAIGDNNGTVSENVLGKETTQFNSGEVCYLLNNGETDGSQVWYQTIDSDSYPLLDNSHKTVYASKPCLSKFSNRNAPVYVEHSMTAHPANAATCTKAGNYAYWTCSNENGVYYKNAAGTDTFASLDDTVIQTISHNMTPHPANAATCTKAGNYAYWTCSNENGVYYKNAAGTDTFANLSATVIPASGHNMTAVPAKEPTCTEDGNYDYWTCSREDGVYYKDAAGTEKFESFDKTVIQATPDIHTYSSDCDKTCNICNAERNVTAEHTFDKEIVDNSTLKSSATCTSKAVYYKSCICGEISDTETFTSGSALGHSYTKQVISDAAKISDADCTSPAKYHYSCSRCGLVSTSDAYVFEYGDALGHDYSLGGICKNCDALKNGKDGFKSASITLTDGVILNYYLLLSDTALADSNAYILFTSPQGLDIKTMLSEGVQDSGKYKFSLELRPDQMADVITAQVVYGDSSEGNSVDYSVTKYAENQTGTADTKTSDLINAMLYYGAATQNYTGNNTDNPADKNVTATFDSDVNISDTYKMSLNGTVNGIKVKGASLIAGSLTTIRVKYEVTEGSIDDFTFTCDGAELTPVKEGDFYYIYIRDISPDQIDKMYSIAVTDKNSNSRTLKYSGLTYAKSIIEDTTGKYESTLIDMMKALYYYNKAANAYTNG
ncbi:MAG: hypothetical protein MR503_08165 [Oscillospiraceae bacterium]|nr:hypothetical protein [Oscillospiraceae bacterium]